MCEFKGYHPIVNFVYFAFVIAFCCIFINPVCLILSLLGGILYSAILKGAKSVGKTLKYTLPMIVLMALLNPLFNHRGVSVIAYFPNGNPLTAESLFYGVLTAVMIASVICWFSCYNVVMTSDKFIYLFGKIIPGASLVLSMTLRFVPRFYEQMKEVIKAQKTMGYGAASGSIRKRIKEGLGILSVMTSWSLESAVETSDSMKSRGYGLPGRTAFSLYHFTKRDGFSLMFIVLLSGYIIFAKISGATDFVCFPNISGIKVSYLGTSAYLAHFVLYLFPVFIELWEVRKWKSLKSKI